jgi:hypothetical protein
MSALLHARARRIREQALIRAFHYRQRNHASGAWVRLRRLLTDADEAWLITTDDAELLRAEGLVPDPVGFDLEPPRRIFFVRREQLERLPGRRQVPVRLSREFLEAKAVALVPFPRVRRA